MGTDIFRSSTKGWLLGTLAGWGTILLILAGIVLSLLPLGLNLGWWPILLSVVGLGLIAWKWVSNMMVSYEITPDRLVIRRGIFVKSIDEIELYRIKDVRIDFTIINQLANVGTIGITSSDETTRDAPLVIRDVDRARARREELRELVNAARRQRGVREIDMVHEDFGEPV